MMLAATKLATTCLAALALAACGGSETNGVNSIPTPVPSPSPKPTPTPTPSAAPAGGWADKSNSQGFTALGADATFHLDKASNSVTPRTVAGAGTVAIRYSVADQAYLVTLPGFAEGKLASDSKVLDRSTGSPIGPTVTLPTDLGSSMTYATIASWWSRAPSSTGEDFAYGYLAFGKPTAGDAVPITGSASFTGQFAAVSDAAFSRANEGFVTPIQAGGPVSMMVDFAAGTLRGTLTPKISCDNCFESYLPAIAFNATLAGAGANGFTGSFTTGVPGANSIVGLFVGPAAQENIARFQLPVVDPYGIDGIYHLTGVWATKR